MLLLSATGPAATAAPEPRTVTAIRLTAPVKLDGILDEAAWQVPATGGFMQYDPQNGAPPTERTSVWVGYDDRALYVAARMDDSRPETIVGRLGRRDDTVTSDWFILSLDPYFDRRTGFEFQVNPAGSVADRVLYNDSWDNSSWDGIWESASHRDERGWTVEMRIPFDQLRFTRQEKPVWGINFMRVMPRNKETDSLVPMKKGDSGYVSHFARLEGLDGIRPPRHLEITPYSVAKATFAPAVEHDPFRTGSEYAGAVGADFKVGLKSNLTLDATVNPDFGQVEVDPAEINLSTFETYYEERRPFFIEGANTFTSFGYGGSNNNWGFNWSNPDFFYSRRIGRPPRGAGSDGGPVDIPEWTTILAAAKVTGKIAGNWNLGFLNALTSRSDADIDLAGKRSQVPVEPLSSYGVLRLQRDFNSGRQGLGVITTLSLHDQGQPDLDRLVGRNSLALGVDGWTALDARQDWVLTAWAGASRVNGSREFITALQRSSLHLYQRPDTSHLGVDPEATSLSGWSGRLAVNRQRGHLVFNAALGAISPGFDVNDLGFQYRGDQVNAHLVAGFRQPDPGRVFHKWSGWVGVYYIGDFGGQRLSTGLNGSASFTLKNYWTIDLSGSAHPRVYSKDETRGGVLLQNPAGHSLNLELSSDSRQSVVGEIGGGLGLTDDGGASFWIGPELEWKPRSNLSLSLSLEYDSTRDQTQWVANRTDPRMTETFGTRHVFARLEQKTLSTAIRLNWIFTPKLSLQAYLQPYLSVGAYDRFKELSRPASGDFLTYGEAGSRIHATPGGSEIDPDGPGPAPAFALDNPDFNYKSLRGTVVLRWEYRPGSLLYFVWTQNRADFAHPGDLSLGRDLGDLLRAPGDNVFLVKFTYRLRG